RCCSFGMSGGGGGWLDSHNSYSVCMCATYGSGTGDAPAGRGNIPGMEYLARFLLKILYSVAKRFAIVVISTRKWVGLLTCACRFYTFL
ncbi:MAG: hypothetical protein K2L35_00160, partial [Muribaculaceae bacterium]|nr:hypothetical protein [Muribaculaceae bacterium]